MDTFFRILVLVLVVVIIGGLAYWLYKSNLYWKMVGKTKWRELQPHLYNIRNIHDRTTGAGVKINWIEKNVTKSVKNSFDVSKQAYVEYIDFCKSKNLALPANVDELEELIDSTEDAFFSPSQALDELISRADLVKRLNSLGYLTEEQKHHADFYYAMRVKVINDSASKAVLKISEVNAVNGNDSFSPHSPKVLPYELIGN